MPNSNYEAKKILSDLSLHYEKIDTCKNDCIIYYKEHSDAIECPVCGFPRWKSNKGSGTKEKKIANKVLRYFPITPRLQRIFMSSKIVKDIKWHSGKRINDGVLRHVLEKF